MNNALATDQWPLNYKIYVQIAQPHRSTKQPINGPSPTTNL
jgi:hypothetical protein